MESFPKASHFKLKTQEKLFPPRELNKIEGKPTVSYIIPTMLRQDFTLTLLNDLVNQSYLVTQVVVVDATPADKRDESFLRIIRYLFCVCFLPLLVPFIKKCRSK